jgi:hypothetical protein
VLRTRTTGFDGPHGRGHHACHDGRPRGERHHGPVEPGCDQWQPWVDHHRDGDAQPHDLQLPAAGAVVHAYAHSDAHADHADDTPDHAHAHPASHEHVTGDLDLDPSNDNEPAGLGCALVIRGHWVASRVAAGFPVGDPGEHRHRDDRHAVPRAGRPRRLLRGQYVGQPVRQPAEHAVQHQSWPDGAVGRERVGAERERTERRPPADGRASGPDPGIQLWVRQ